MLAIHSSTCVGEVPSLQEAVSDLLPALGGGGGGSRAGHELIQEFINDGLADLTHYNRDGVVGYPP